MRTILGPFHPWLENALVNEILSHKEADPLRPLLILIPSDALRRYLKTVLGRARGLSLLNVHILTFRQLSWRLYSESGGESAAVQGESFFEEALRRMIRARKPGAAAFAGLEEHAGGSAALWQTLRDLRDGGVDAAACLEALQEGHFSSRAAQRTSQVLAALKVFEDLCRAKELMAESDLDRRAAGHVPESPFLKQFSLIFYYGFYDLTQIQLDFFHAVARHYPTKLFFPLLVSSPGHAGWRFAERFYESYVQGRQGESASRCALRRMPGLARLFDDGKERKYATLPEEWRCRIASTFGLSDEVAAVAKEILRLTEDGKVNFSEIGVTARSLESYGPVIRRVFDLHRIPCAGTFESLLVESPLVKAAILLLHLPAKDFLRSQVIDLLSSPYFRFQNPGGDRPPPRPDLWDLATRELAICRGAAGWRRLRRYRHRDLAISLLSDDEEPRKLHIPGAQLALLEAIVEALIADLAELPAEAPWSRFAAAWKVLLEKYLGVADDADLSSSSEERAAQVEILAVLDNLAALDAVEDRVSLGDFSRTFLHWLERSRLTEDLRNSKGVLVLTATAARGLSFRVLFVLGLNEGVFPRTIREDAFLRDGEREVLERDLGYKVGQKLAAFDEEKLLLSLLTGAARERLYCSFQRADDNGRALSPSWYIDELQRTLKACGRAGDIASIPRGRTEKRAVAPFDQSEFLLPEELAIRLILAGEDPSALIEATSPLPSVGLHGRQIVAEIERTGVSLSAYDGMLGRFERYWKHFSERGLVPTALETYARCPFQFFARYVLGLEPLERPEESFGPSAAEYGELGHEILRAFYRDLIESGHFTGTAAADIDTRLQSAAARAFARYEAEKPVGYPLAWESLKRSLTRILGQVVDRDLTEMARSGFAPVGVEIPVKARLPEDWPESIKEFALRGRMDRIDRKGSRVRVVDYKFKFGAAPHSEDKNLLTAALRGARLQPPFYCLLARTWAEEAAGIADPEVEADFYYIAERWPDGPLVPVPYSTEDLCGQQSAAIRQTVADLADGIRHGRFFIHPGTHCGRCDMVSLCRKSHPPSLWRAENDPLTQAHRKLHRRDAKKL